MTFQEIFNKDGLYKADDFTEGTALEVNDGTLYMVCYSDANDLQPTRNTMPVYKGLFTKVFTKVFTRQSLFTKK